MSDDAFVKILEILNAMKATSGGTAQDWTDNLDAPISGLSPEKHKIVVLTSDTSWTHPGDLPANKLVYITMCGGGGSGGKEDNSSEGGQGGGGGGILVRVPYICTGSSTAYAIGAGGAAISSGGNPGNPGTHTHWDNALYAPGGGGGEVGSFDNYVHNGGGTAPAEVNTFDAAAQGHGKGPGMGGGYLQPGGNGGPGKSGGSVAGLGGYTGFGKGGADDGESGGGGASLGDGADAPGGDAAANSGGGGAGEDSSGNSGAGGSGKIIIEYWTD